MYTSTFCYSLFCRNLNSNMGYIVPFTLFYLDILLPKFSDPETCPTYCKNNGVCEFSYLNGVSCDCTGTGYIGTTCESKCLI